MSNDKKIILVLFNDFAIENARYSKNNLEERMARKNGHLTKVDRDTFEIEDTIIIFKNFEKNKDILTKYNKNKIIFIQNEFLNITPDLEIKIKENSKYYYVFGSPSQIISDIEKYLEEYIDTNIVTGYRHESNGNIIISKQVEGYMINSNYYQYFASKQDCINFHINQFELEQEKLIKEKIKIDLDITEVQNKITSFRNLE